MKRITLLFAILLVVSCKQKQEEVEEPEVVKDNKELAEIYEADQSDRRSQNINWIKVSERDSLRRIRVNQLLDSNKVVTSKDYKNAAMVFQHGKDSTHYGKAVKLMEKSVALDSNANKWLLAAATDRYLLSKGEPQIYGTQYHRMGNEPWKLADIDTTKITDEERMDFGVETLAEQREKVKRMNQKKVSELLDAGKDIDAIIRMIKEDAEVISSYDVSENALNNLGYSLMRNGNTREALKIFKLNTELYPGAYNTYDSYGECLLELGDKKKAVMAYEKSLELNPENENAKEVLENMNI